MICGGAFRRVCATLGLTLALLAPCVAPAQIAVPALVGHVTDLTATLSAAQLSALEQTLSALEARKGSQLAVLIVPTTAPEAIEPFALRVADQWKLGRKKVDDGAILVIAKDDRSLRIEVGYGLEGVLTDITSKRIISETITPRFQQGDFAGGIEAGINQIISVVEGEPLPAPENRRAAGYQDLRDLVPFLFVVALAVGGILRNLLGRIPGALVTGAVVSALAWFVIGTLFLSLLAGVAAMFATLIGVGRLAYGLGGLGGGGGSGGGGFRGGGGGFGGGGASGRW